MTDARKERIVLACATASLRLRYNTMVCKFTAARAAWMNEPDHRASDWPLPPALDIAEFGALGEMATEESSALATHPQLVSSNVSTPSGLKRLLVCIFRSVALMLTCL